MESAEESVVLRQGGINLLSVGDDVWCLTEGILNTTCMVWRVHSFLHGMWLDD